MSCYEYLSVILSNIEYHHQYQVVSEHFGVKTFYTIIHKSKQVKIGDIQSAITGFNVLTNPDNKLYILCDVNNIFEVTNGCSVITYGRYVNNFEIFTESALLDKFKFFGNDVVNKHVLDKFTIDHSDKYKPVDICLPTKINKRSHHGDGFFEIDCTNIVFISRNMIEKYIDYTEFNTIDKLISSKKQETVYHQHTSSDITSDNKL